MNDYIVIRKARLVQVVAAIMILVTVLGAGSQVRAVIEGRPDPPCRVDGASAARLIETLSVPADSADGITTSVLQEGETYELVVSGSFAFNRAGGASDGFDLKIDGDRLFQTRSSEQRYCVRLRGAGNAVHLLISDSYYLDNTGHLSVELNVIE
jgi:hypothetical protein